MTKLAYLARILGALRREKEPPVSRYACITGCAAAIEKSGDAGATVRDIAKACGERHVCDIASQVQRLKDAGFLEVVHPYRPQTYRPSSEGLRVIAPLVNLAPVVTQANR